MLEALVTEFEAVEDPRDPCKVEHRLVDILVIAVCAVIGAAESFEDMADYGRCEHEWLKRFLALPNGRPGHPDDPQQTPEVSETVMLIANLRRLIRVVVRLH